MDSQAEAEKVYDVLLTRGGNPVWRTSPESLHFQNLYFKMGFSLSIEQINEVRKSIVVELLNSLVQGGENFISCYAFTERANMNTWKQIVNSYGERLPAYRGYPWRQRGHNDSDPRELTYCQWRVWRGLTVDYKNQYSDSEPLDESTNPYMRKYRLASAMKPVSTDLGVEFLEGRVLSSQIPDILNLSGNDSYFEKQDEENTLAFLRQKMPTARGPVSLEDFETVCDLLNLIRCVFYVRTLQVGAAHAVSAYHQLKSSNQFVRQALVDSRCFVSPDLIEYCHISVDGFGRIDTMIASDHMASLWARKEFRLCDSVLVQDLDTHMLHRDLELEAQCNAPLLDWDISEGPLDVVLNTRFNIPKDTLHNICIQETQVLVYCARPALLRVLARVEGTVDIPLSFGLATGLVNLSLGVPSTGGTQAVYHLVAAIPQKEDGNWDRILRCDPGVAVGWSCSHLSAKSFILIYALFDKASISYFDLRRKTWLKKEEPWLDREQIPVSGPVSTVQPTPMPSIFGSPSYPPLNTVNPTNTGTFSFATPGQPPVSTVQPAPKGIFSFGAPSQPLPLSSLDKKPPPPSASGGSVPQEFNPFAVSAEQPARSHQSISKPQQKSKVSHQVPVQSSSNETPESEIKNDMIFSRETPAPTQFTLGGPATPSQESCKRHAPETPKYPCRSQRNRSGGPGRRGPGC